MFAVGGVNFGCRGEGAVEVLKKYMMGQLPLGMEGLFKTTTPPDGLDSPPPGPRRGEANDEPRAFRADEAQGVPPKGPVLRQGQHVEPAPTRPPVPGGEATSHLPT